MVGIFTPGNSLESVYFWIHLSLILEMVLWLYFVNYPTLFFPVDVIKKFGFNRPMGLFVDQSTGEIIKQAVSKEDFDLFKAYAEKQSIVADLMNFYESQPDLSDEEVWNTLTDEERGSSIIETYVLTCVKTRAMQEALSVNIKKHKKEADKFDEGAFKYLKTFSNWKKIYKKL